jgi:hypothetical protein
VLFKPGHFAAPEARVFRTVPVVILAVAAAAACATQQQSATADSPPPGGTEASMNELSAQERSHGWRLLFDGRTVNGWRVYRSAAQPTGWSVRDGALTKESATDDILTVDQFADFDLVFDWRVSQGGNAGVFYRATEEYEKVYWSATEYQLLDDANARDGQNRLTSAGANYGLYPAPAGALKPAGEWNTTRIVVRGNRAEHWLNGVKLLEYEYGSPDWEARVKASKFSAWPNYGRAKRGHIAIQGDHGGVLALRNVKIREL